ncbi:MAG TPA: hypothetical protein DDZ51_20155 [Planctomycetaceae bacterium]|nr:hypothetical protein [Planctomycetaceae bacterium]
MTDSHEIRLANDDAPQQDNRWLQRLSYTAVIALAIAFIIVGAIGFGLSIREAQRAAMRVNSQSPLNQIVLALHNYHDHYGQFPPAYVADENGRPMHSWRALILPFIEYGNLYDQYDFSEPWNGPNNSKLADRMPRTYWSQSEPPSTMYTNVVLITGPGTVFPGAQSTRLDDITDGTQNTILVTETAGSTIPWLAPRDIELVNGIVPLGNSEKLGRPAISAVAWRRPWVAFADSIHCYEIDDKIPPASLSALTTIKGGEAITRDKLIQQDLIR